MSVRCEEVRTRLTEYQLGLLEGPERARIEQHMQGCQRCAEELAALERLDELVQPLERVEAPAELWTNVQARMKPRRRSVWTALRQWWGESPRMAIAAGTAMILAAIGIWLSVGGPLEGPDTTDTLAAEYQQQQIVAQWSQPLADDAALGMMFASLDGADAQ